MCVTLFLCIKQCPAWYNTRFSEHTECHHRHIAMAAKCNSQPENLLLVPPPLTPPPPTNKTIVINLIYRENLCSTLKSPYRLQPFLLRTIKSFRTMWFNVKWTIALVHLVHSGHAKHIKSYKIGRHLRLAVYAIEPQLSVFALLC